MLTPQVMSKDDLQNTKLFTLQAFSSGRDKSLSYIALGPLTSVLRSLSSVHHLMGLTPYCLLLTAYRGFRAPSSIRRCIF